MYQNVCDIWDSELGNMKAFLSNPISVTDQHHGQQPGSTVAVLMEELGRVFWSHRRPIIVVIV